MTPDRESLPRHPIRLASRRTGLTPALPRAWEKRYGVVTPSRSDGGQRLYSDKDVHRLGLLRRVVEEGRAISQVASLSFRELQDLVEEDRNARLPGPAPWPLDSASVPRVLEQAKGAGQAMDPAQLERILTRGAMALPGPQVIDDIIVPLLSGIGESWKEGDLGPAHEHLSSGVIRRFLEWLLGTIDPGDEALLLISATPARERHQLGALLAAVSAASEGWRASFLGPDLPAREIAAAAIQLGACVVALPLVDPALGASAPEELRALAETLPASIRLVVGWPPELIGQIRPILPEVEFMESLAEFRDNLRREWVR